jgi:glycogen synthase
VFDRATAAALEEAVTRALSAHADPGRWRPMMRAAMSQDHSWTSAAAQYRLLYDELLDDRQAGGVSAAGGLSRRPAAG